MTKIYRDYDAAALERQYLPAYWPGVDVPDTIDRWIIKSDAFHRRIDVVADVAYGDSDRQKIDLLRPTRTANSPVVAFIHGGYWRSTRLTKKSYSFCVEPIVSAGALVAMVEYDLCPTVTMDTLVGQVRKACAWIWRHVGDYGGDPARLHVAGHSAGGHLAAMMAATEWPALQAGLPGDLVKSIVPISGLFQLEPLRLVSLNSDLRLDAEMAQRNSPLFTTPSARMPVSVVVGGAESDEFRRQSRAFADGWKTAATSYLETAGHNHFTVIEAMTEAENPLTATILRHLQP